MCAFTVFFKQNIYFLNQAMYSAWSSYIQQFCTKNTFSAGKPSINLHMLQSFTFIYMALFPPTYLYVSYLPQVTLV